MSTAATTNRGRERPQARSRRLRPLVAAVASVLCVWLAGAAVARPSQALATALTKAATPWTARAVACDRGSGGIVITVLRDPDFGSLIVGGGGTATLSPTGAVTTTGNVYGAGGMPQAALLEVSGPLGDDAALRSPATALLPRTLRLTGRGGTVLVLRDLTVAPVGAGPGAGGRQQLAVGGTLQLAGGQAPDAYAGEVEVVVTYN